MLVPAHLQALGLGLGGMDDRVELVAVVKAENHPQQARFVVAVGGGQPVGERYRAWLGRAFAVGEQEHLLNPVRPGELGEGFALRGFAGAVEQVDVAVLQRLQRSDPRQFDKFELAVRLFGQGAEQHKLTAGELPVAFVNQRIPLFPADAQAAVLPQGQPGGDEQQAAEKGAECAHD